MSFFEWNLNCINFQQAPWRGRRAQDPDLDEKLPLSLCVSRARTHNNEWMHFWTFSALLSMLTRWARERTRAFVIGNSRWDVSSAKIYRCSINSSQYFILSHSACMGESMYVHDILADGGREVNESAALWDWAISRIKLMSRESQVSPLIKTWNLHYRHNECGMKFDLINVGCEPMNGRLIDIFVRL